MDLKTALIVFGAVLFALVIGVFSQPPQMPENTSENVTVVAEDLDIPWEIEFLPNGDLLVTERPGTLLRIEANGNTTRKYEVEGVEHRGEGGLMGIARHPNFTENSYIYLYMTTEAEEGLQNRVARYKLEGKQLESPETIIGELPGASYHDGGRIEFGPDEKLYITVGDATNEKWAQKTDILAGKILRLNANGSIPEDNPFNNSVYSYGHRNPQGLVWMESQLWATEHGRSGLRSGMDELNRIEKGKNYGWPDIEGNETQEGMEMPKIHSGSDTTWAPAGAAYADGSIFFAGLRGSTLYEAEIEDGEVQKLGGHFQDQFGRLRAVVKGPNGNLYFTTSNTDGRGNPRTGDDKLLRIDPRLLEQDRN